jgi:hypothetical protein
MQKNVYSSGYNTETDTKERSALAHDNLGQPMHNIAFSG